MIRILTLAIVFPFSAQAEDLTIEFDLSNPRVFELIEPLNRNCLEKELALGSTLESAKSRAPECIKRVLLSGAELERVLRVHFPHDISPEELESCIRTVAEEDSILACARKQTQARKPPSQ